MISSWQVSQLHAQQGQAFSAQQSYSQQLSAMMPSPYQGIGATGFGGNGFGQGPGFGYNYGAGFNSYGPSNSFGNSVTSTIGGAVHTLGSAMPIIGGLAGFKMGGMGGLAIGGLGMAVGAGIKHFAGSMMEGAHEQSAIEKTLSQFQFANAGSRTGRGFSRNDSMQIGNMVRQMERIPEMLTSFGELNRLMDKMGQMGLMQGVRDAGDFMRKFRDTVGTIKDLAKVMGTTMEGALQAFGEARLSGFYSQGDITKNVLNRQITSSITGMNQSQIGAIQQIGAQMGHGTGGSRRTGAQHMLRTAGQLGMANQLGILSNDQIVEMTGKEGAEGIQDLSVQMSQLGYRMARSNVGQALTLALGEMKDGRYTGRMDQELVERVRRGDLSLSDLKSMARGKARTRTAKLSFAAHKERLRSEMAGSVGAEGMAMQLQEILGNRGWHNPDAVNLVMQRFGASEEEANLLQQVMPNLQSIGTQMGLAGRNESRRAAVGAVQKEHGWDAIKAKIGKKMAHYTTDWAKDLGAGMRDHFQNWADGFMDDLSGQYREYVTKRVSDAVRGSIGGVGSSRMAVSQMSGRALDFGSGLGGSRMDVGSIGGIRGILSRGLHSFSGSTTAGERAISVLSSLDKSLLSTETGIGLNGAGIFNSGADNLAASGAMVLDSSVGWLGRSSATGITPHNVKRAMARFSELNTEVGGLAEYNKAISGSSIGTNDSDRLLREAYQAAMNKGEIALEKDPSKQADKVWNEMRNYLGKGKGQQVLKDLDKMGMSGLRIVAGVQAAEQKSGRRYRAAINFEAIGSGLLGGMDITNQAAIGRRIEEIDRSLSKVAKGSDTQASWADVKKLIDSGSQMTALLIGSDTTAGLLGGADQGTVDARFKNGGSYDDISGNTIRNIAARDPSTWTEVDKKSLQKIGVDADKLAQEIDSNPQAFDRIRSLAASGKLDAKTLQQYIAASDASGLNSITKEMNRQGRGLSSRLTGDSYKQGRTKLLSTKEGAEVFMMLGSQAAGLEGVDAKNIGRYSDNSSDIAAKIEALKDPAMRQLALELGGSEIGSVYSYRRSTRKSLRGGMGIDSVLRAGGLNLGQSDADAAIRKQIEGLLGSNGKLDRGEIEGVLNTLTGLTSGSIRSSSGNSTNSKYASEQEVANSLVTLSDNTRKLSQIVANLAGGKTGADAMEGVK